MNRRTFIQTAALATTAVSTMKLTTVLAAEATPGVHWPIGCFNRPWVNPEAGWTLETCLDGLKNSGYQRMGLLTPFKDQPFIGVAAKPDYLADLKKQIAARNLKAVMGAIHTKPELALEDSIKNVRQQIDNAKFLELEHLLTFGVDHEKDYDDYYKLMADAAPYAHERGIKLVLKPHGGGSGSAEEIQRCMEKVNHPNFKIWYDAGNIIYYTGKDPIEQLKPIVQHVTGFCAKDCAVPKGEVWLDFGAGKVDFLGVFKLLKTAGFNGPVMVECCAKGKTLEDTTAGARRNREFLEKIFQQV